MLDKEDNEILSNQIFEKKNIYKIIFKKYYEIHEFNIFFKKKFKKILVIDIVHINSYYEKIGELSIKELIGIYKFELIYFIKYYNIDINRKIKSFSYFEIKCLDFLINLKKDYEFIINTNDAMAIVSINKFYSFLYYLKNEEVLENICIICFDFDSIENTKKTKINIL